MIRFIKILIMLFSFNLLSAQDYENVLIDVSSLDHDIKIDLKYKGVNNFTFTNAFSGAGDITLDEDGTGVITLSGNSTNYTGDFDINGNTVILNHANALGTGTLISSGGSMSVASGITLNQLTTSGTLNISSNVNSSGEKLVSLLGINSTLPKCNSPDSISICNLVSSFTTTFLSNEGLNGILTILKSINSPTELFDFFDFNSITSP